MGGLCSKPGRSKRRKEEYDKQQAQRKDLVSSTVENGEQSAFPQIRPSQQKEGGAINEETGEETLRIQEEDMASEKLLCTEPTVVEVNTLSHCLSEKHDPAPVIRTEKEKADWVDNNRAKLIQSVKNVTAIADEMLDQRIIHKETYANIKVAGTSMDQMRNLYDALTTPKAKSAFCRILKEHEPAICATEDVIREVMRNHKEDLREKFQYELEGNEKDRKDAKSLDKIYTELHIIQGESEHVNTQHEIWEIENKTWNQVSEGIRINCNNIFRGATEEGNSSGKGRSEIRTVMTKGIAGIGKTVSVKRFILDWADGTANQDFDFIFVLPFRELNLIIDEQFSLETLVKEFHPKLKNIPIARMFDMHKVLFIFDGLDESQLELNFKTTKRLTDTRKESSMDTLITNLIREHLLPSAYIWITSRPGAVHRIPRQHVYQWTEVRGFDDPQKIEYFTKRIEDKAVAERVINNITMSRSLYIMCHIPIFCWITAKVLVHMLLKKTQEHLNIPTTLTEMYTHFLCIQMQVATQKYDNQNGSDTEGIFESNKEFILKLGRMAFEHLTESKIMFTGSDLKHYGIDIHQAGIYCGLCTEIFKEENVFTKKKLYCFVHLTVQEYFAALFVYRSFATKKIDSLSLKDFLLKGSEEELKDILDVEPVDLPVNELVEISIANSALRKAGELDMFLRFLTGLSLQSTQELLQGLIQQSDDHSEVVNEIKISLMEIDLLDCSAERCLNHVHCLTELKDSSLLTTMKKYLEPSHSPEKQLSPVQCSALADLILTSNTPLDEFDLRKYRPSGRGVFRLLPAIRNSRRARISGVWLDTWISETIASALQMPNSVLTELHLTNGVFGDKSRSILLNGLKSPHCKLESLSLSGTGLACEMVISTIKSIFPKLTELELSERVVGHGPELCSVFSDGLGKLKKLRLNRYTWPAEICEMLVAAFTSNPCDLQELELNSNILDDSELELLCTGLISTNCKLAKLSLSHNRLTERGCEELASVLCTKSCDLTDLDLSYNDLQDSGVTALRKALMNPHCGLKTLRLSFCKVTENGCAALASALRSEHCGLKELDLSFNHPADQGVQTLTEIQRDPCCSLVKLNVDQNEEYWFDLKLLRQYACDLTLDLNTAGVKLILTEENKKATFKYEKQPYPDNPERFSSRQVLCEEGLTGRHYWEAECDDVDVAVAYKSIPRTGDSSSEYVFGENEKSWCFCLSDWSFKHNNVRVLLTQGECGRTCTMGVYLDWPAGILSFFQVFPHKITHLHTVCTSFSDPLYPGFSFNDNGSVRICKLEQP